MAWRGVGWRAKLQHILSTRTGTRMCHWKAANRNSHLTPLILLLSCPTPPLSHVSCPDVPLSLLLPSCISVLSRVSHLLFVCVLTSSSLQILSGAPDTSVTWRKLLYWTWVHSTFLLVVLLLELVLAQLVLVLVRMTRQQRGRRSSSSMGRPTLQVCFVCV